jgi:ABC-2 type transport system permease protein
MRKFWYILNKEVILLFRDIPGLVILFLMPVLLIFVVTLAQDKALQGQNGRTALLFADQAGSVFSGKLALNLDSSGFFKLEKEIANLPVSPARARELIGKGEYTFGLIIPKGDSAITLLVDPTLQENYRVAVVNSLTFIIKGTQTREAMNDILSGLPGDMKPVIEGMIAEKIRKLPPLVESYARKDSATIQPNVIQNNVPGFILFAMFFIVIPLAGSLISEKSEGSFQRLKALPVHLSAILGGKVIAYLCVCLIQFVLMMIIGTWVFPTFFGLPALSMGHRYVAIAVATVAASLAAIGFGILVGSAASTHNQAALFGSVMVVLLGVISGTFLPIHIMPAFIRAISLLSPIRWGIDNYLDLFIREGSLVSILPNTLLLLLFFVFAMITSIAIFAKWRR